MRVIQTYVTWGRDPFYDKQLATDIDKLISSAIQWKFVFPKDTIHLYLGPREYNYFLKTFSPFEQNIWDSINYLTQNGLEYKKFSKLPYTGARFWSIYQQAEPVVFIDPDVFVWPEFREDSKYRKWVDDVENGKPSVLVDRTSMWTKTPRELFETIEKIANLGKFSSEFYKGVATNTGILGYHPVLRECIARIMECQKVYFNNSLRTKVPHLLEITDGCIIKEVIKQMGLKEYVLDSKYLLHWLVGWPKVPEFIEPRPEVTLEQTGLAWKGIFDFVRKERKGLSSKEFQKLFLKFLENSESIKETKKLV